MVKESPKTRSAQVATRSTRSTAKRKNLDEEESMNVNVDLDQLKDDDTEISKRICLTTQSNSQINTGIDENKTSEAVVNNEKLEDTSSFKVVEGAFKDCSCPRNVMHCIGILPAAPIVTSMDESDSDEDEEIISEIFPPVKRASHCNRQG